MVNKWWASIFQLMKNLWTPPMWWSPKGNLCALAAAGSHDHVMVRLLSGAAASCVAETTSSCFRCLCIMSLSHQASQTSQWIYESLWINEDLKHCSYSYLFLGGVYVPPLPRRLERQVASFNFLMPKPLKTHQKTAGVWGVAFAALHFANLALLLRERNHGLHLSDEQEEIYERGFQSHGVTPRQFTKLLKAILGIGLKCQT